MAEEQLSARALCTLEDVKLYGDPDDPTDDKRDPLLTRLINAASEEIYRVARNREFVAVNAVRSAAGVVTAAPQTRVFEAFELNGRRLRIGDLAQLDSLTIDGLAVGSSVTRPRVRAPWQPITSLVLDRTTSWNSLSTISIAGVWGFPAIPENLRQACIVTVNMWAARDLESFSEVFVAAEGRVEIPRSLPQQAWDTAWDYRRKRPARTIRIG